MYYELYNMLAGYIYGADVALTTFQDLTLTIVSTVGVLFVVLAPICFAWRILKFVL